MERLYRFGIAYNEVRDQFCGGQIDGDNDCALIEYIRDFLPDAKVEAMSFEYVIDDTFQVRPVTVGEKRINEYEYFEDTPEWDMTLENGQVFTFYGESGSEIKGDKGFVLFRKTNPCTLGDILSFSEENNFDFEKYKRSSGWGGFVITAPFEDAILKFIQMKYGTFLTIRQANKYRKDRFDFEIGSCSSIEY